MHHFEQGQQSIKSHHDQVGILQSIRTAYCICRCRVLRGVLASRAGRWLKEAAQADPTGTFYRRMVKVMGEVVERLAQL
jgi:hypothetical protein